MKSEAALSTAIEEPRLETRVVLRKPTTEYTRILTERYGNGVFVVNGTKRGGRGYTNDPWQVTLQHEQGGWFLCQPEVGQLSSPPETWTGTILWVDWGHLQLA